VAKKPKRRRPARSTVTGRSRGSRSDTPKGKRETPPAGDLEGDPVPEGLNPAQHTFALEYLANGFNGTQAYMKAYPEATYTSAQRAAFTLLRNIKMVAFLRPQLAATWKARQMDGEEALARIAAAATLDVRLFLDADGNLLAPKDWPDEAAQLIESYEVERGKLKLVSKTVALRTILEQTGKLKTLPDSIDALADAIKQDLEAHANKGAGE